MTAVGVWLVAVGLCDLLRATEDATSRGRRAVIAATGLAVLLAGGLWLAEPGPAWILVGVVWAIGLLAWVLTSSAALEPDGAHPRRWRAAAFVSLALPLVVLLVLGGAAAGRVDLPPGLDGSLLARVGAASLVLHAGVALTQLSTSNLVVRLVLDAVGVPAGTNEKELRGGRLLGPMERLFILALGLAGELTAAAVVVAAKGLLRFPELRRTSREEGPTDVSEYFLIGSFTSWLLAIGGLVVAHLA